MSAYSAVVSLEQLLNQLLISDLIPKAELLSLHGNISSLKSSLETIFPAPKKDRDEANKLEIQIREKIFEAQDTIESFIFFTQNHPPESSETSKSQSLTSISLQKIIASIDPITEEAEKLEHSISASTQQINESSANDLIKKKMEKIAYGREEQPESHQYLYYKASAGPRSTKIVGQEKYKEQIKKMLMAGTGRREVVSITGELGVGKTTLARNIYNDSIIRKQFPYCAWVTVSQDDDSVDVLRKLLNSLESRGQKAGDKVYGDEALLRIKLHQALSSNKYLVVIDNLWDQKHLEKLILSLPDNENRSRVLVTSRAGSDKPSNSVLVMQPLDEIDSWTFLRIMTFGGDNTECPADLENIGRRIAKNCKGLPLSLTLIGGLLSHVSENPDFWRSIEEDTRAATSDAKNEPSATGILSLSYDLLPCKLKGCFLYMGAFPRDSDIPVSKLIMLWVAEGFLTTPPSQLIEEVAEQSLLELIDRNLVLVRKSGVDGRIKYCGMDESLRDLAEKEAGKDMFFHLRKRHPQKPEQDTNTQRRVSVHKNILMCLEEVYNSTKTIENARSLLYVGPHHHHPMPFNLTFDLLRILDAFTSFFIEFPYEILKLIHLRYLSFTYNGKLPSRISRLQKLQVLIVKRQPKVIYGGTPFLPDEIWNMKELRHLLITETDLPPLLSPTEQGSNPLENLQTLSNVNAASCTQEVLGNMPNLKRITMWVEAPGKVGLYLNKLDQLEAFKLTVLEPIPGKKIDFQPKLFFPHTVRKLNLSGTGLPWEDMEAVAKLPNLEVLKLKEFAFHGDEWCPDYTFKKLKFLLMEYLDLKWLDAESCPFPILEKLIVRHCYDLEAIPSEIGALGFLRLIELVDCSPDAVKSAVFIKTEQREVYGIDRIHLRTYSSWE